MIFEGLRQYFEYVATKSGKTMIPVKITHNSSNYHIYQESNQNPKLSSANVNSKIDVSKEDKIFREQNERHKNEQKEHHKIEQKETNRNDQKEYYKSEYKERLNPPRQSLSERAKERKVPASRLGRLVSFGSK